MVDKSLLNNVIEVTTKKALLLQSLVFGMGPNNS